MAAFTLFIVFMVAIAAKSGFRGGTLAEMDLIGGGSIIQAQFSNDKVRERGGPKEKPCNEGEFKPLDP